MSMNKEVRSLVIDQVLHQSTGTTGIPLENPEVLPLGSVAVAVIH